MTRQTTTLAAALLLCASGLHAQEGIARRVDAAPDGEVRISFASKPEVCGRDEGLSIRRGTMSQGSGAPRSEECMEGPVHVSLMKRGGRVTGLDARVAYPFRDRGGRVTDLGTVDPGEAAGYLLALAERGTNGSVGKEAIFLATLARGVTTWPALLRIARRDDGPPETRSSAVFWLGEEASEAATRGLQEIVDADGDQEVRKEAVFALFRRPGAVPSLIRIARTHRDPELRRTALFWLGQLGVRE